MSWATGADRESESTLTEEQINYYVTAINGILGQFSRDSDLQEDLEETEVKAAIKHWTGEKRLPAEEAMRFQDNYRIMGVMRKIQKLQQACKSLGIAVPLDHVVHKREIVSPEIIAPLIASAKRRASGKQGAPVGSSTTTDKKPVTQKSGSASASTAASSKQQEGQKQKTNQGGSSSAVSANAAAAPAPTAEPSRAAAATAAGTVADTSNEDRAPLFNYRDILIQVVIVVICCLATLLFRHNLLNTLNNRVPGKGGTLPGEEDIGLPP